MKAKLMITAALLSLTAAGYAGAAEKTAQQHKMTVCNQQAGEKSLKGDDRKTFMSNCLKKDSKTEAITPQQEKMKTCNSQAGEKMLKGDARKTFISSCLKKV
ncbi:phosphate starvation-inducible protein [Erwinia amylovora]|uniref:PsiF family protein n=1 Tax=Erwinia amylovora TaxID=552 RepID=UPI000C08652B|nr:PsiF family protein [Erwinia amylovora]UDJ87594.1 phosphate starvation-inducible protein [Erwinia amylovora]UDJ99051.1 phosphate starvation-inducible protein [Erwinia amylovora]UDK88891.1 phosphate starvation-inducible protein [Erwinia amylovora]UDK92288.1 phosphate starvation-inducible protein [Erwinia amylovora]UOD76308.1 phosphate starvation-inducible protein [Erwinia amylovora]